MNKFSIFHVPTFHTSYALVEHGIVTCDTKSVPLSPEVIGISLPLNIFYRTIASKRKISLFVGFTKVYLFL
jgi:hypothetical protein